ncbi:MULTISPECIES: hypothetical protein [unclassified Amycolatopsis]|uniref:hypothetical protein n=1 Tax=unclassified Amycolatopsis TaxID=2618356 RepID=UPI003456FA21
MITDEDSVMVVFGVHTTRAVTESPALAARGRTDTDGLGGLWSPVGGVGLSEVGGTGVLDVGCSGVVGVVGVVASAAKAGAARRKPAATIDEITAMRFMEFPLK